MWFFFIKQETMNNGCCLHRIDNSIHRKSSFYLLKKTVKHAKRVSYATACLPGYKPNQGLYLWFPLYQLSYILIRREFLFMMDPNQRTCCVKWGESLNTQNSWIKGEYSACTIYLGSPLAPAAVRSNPPPPHSTGWRFRYDSKFWSKWHES